MPAQMHRTAHNFSCVRIYTVRVCYMQARAHDDDPVQSSDSNSRLLKQSPQLQIMYAWCRRARFRSYPNMRIVLTYRRPIVNCMDCETKTRPKNLRNSASESNKATHAYEQWRNSTTTARKTAASRTIVRTTKTAICYFDCIVCTHTCIPIDTGGLGLRIVIDLAVMPTENSEAMKRVTQLG